MPRVQHAFGLRDERHEPVAERIEHIGDRLARAHPVADFAPMQDHARHRRVHVLASGERRRGMAQRGRLGRLARDHPDMRQIVDDRLRVARRHLVRHVAHTAQFQRDRLHAHRNRKTLAERAAQIAPHRCARFVERLAARHVREQLRLAAEKARERLDRGPRFGRRVQMRDGFPVAMQIDDEIRVASELHQFDALRFEFGRRLHRLEMRA